tara:strand:+ start:633 stop:1172 length:540 start_codon:yes stop_codon:yes gene_type:complete
MHNKNLPNIYHFIDNLDIESILNYNKNICVIYRNYNSKIDIKKILNFKKICKKSRIKFLISNEMELAFKLKLDGVYIPSFNKIFSHKKFHFFRDFIIIGSAHSIKEMRIKERQNVQQIFLSPLFKTNKSNKFLGINKFNNLSKLTKKPLIALGGINKSNIKLLKLIKGVGFAGIRYFKK